MPFLGRNFDFRVPPEAEARDGQCVVPGTGTPIPIGAPIQVLAGDVPDALGMKHVHLAVSGGVGDPDNGLKGILVYEHTQYIGDDPVRTTYSQKGEAPLGAHVQMVSGRDVVVVFRNTTHQTFLVSRDIPARTMVAGLGATPTVAVGDYLAPGVGTDTDGYWAEVSTIGDAWLVVTAIDTARGEVEARMLI